ncbi:MAG: tripartite tricarboxylate transporter TctB family protein [Hyphomicrobiales bacterium]|nr:tripartite tricarboxylate transporter TctB family protein [Hyphomicrobiales bacterium]
MGTGRRRPGGDTWIALGLIAANAVFLRDLFDTEPGGAYLKTTTLPIALSVSLTVLSVLLLGWSLLRPAAPQAEAAAEPVPGPPPAVRVLAATLLTAGYIAALPWFGYLMSSCAYFAAMSLLYGNRNPVSIVAVMVAVPLALMLFFEQYMIVLLPSAGLFE